jgi:hypothetical protein
MSAGLQVEDCPDAMGACAQRSVRSTRRYARPGCAGLPRRRHRRRRLVLHTAALPFADAVFDSVVAVWLSTDVDDFAAVIGEAAPGVG